MQDKGIIKKVAPGIYIDVNIEKDNYYIFCLSMPNVIFSHMTVLYFHGLSKKTPNCVYDIERSICDIIRSKTRMDLKLVTSCVKKYIKSKLK